MKKLFILTAIIISFLSFSDIVDDDTFINDATVSNETLEDFDSEYVHDEVYINMKTDELRQQLSNAYEQIDNMIIFDSLMESFSNWKGTKYKWGGDSKKGIDCSAFTRRVYDEVFEYRLPRVSVEQVKSGTRIDKKDLKPGDIIYFKPKNRTNHVGIYVGNSLFLHASSSKGVVLSSLDNSYWKKYYKYSVRINKARQTDEVN